VSEYQYYEFQAIDRPLTKAEMAEIRALSTRAEITPNRFMNVYNWGDFKGDPDRLIEKYYDVFLYEANWGSRQFMVRLPAAVFRLEDVRPYAVEDDDASLQIRMAGDQVILDFHVRDEEGDRWIEDEDSEAWLPSLLPIRDQIANGDFRSLYFGWLVSAETGILDDETVEPPVPSDLGNLSPELEKLREFLGINRDLIAIAAQRSASVEVLGPSRGEIAQWLASLPESEKNELLLRIVDGEGRFLRGELLNRFRASRAPSRAHARDENGRTVGELLAAAEHRRVTRERAEAESRAAEAARREREAASARAAYLDSLVGKEEILWQQVESNVELKNARGYDEALRLLTNLGDLAERANQKAEFHARLAEFRERHARKPALQSRLQKFG